MKYVNIVDCRTQYSEIRVSLQEVYVSNKDLQLTIRSFFSNLGRNLFSIVEIY